MTNRRKPGSARSQRNDDSEAFLSWLEDVPDPRERYRRATEELEKHQQAVEQLSAIRAAAASDAYKSGQTFRALADELGVSPARVHQLIQEAKSRSDKETGKKRRPPGRQKGEA
jgi:DNA-directed RNA polymerase specialized sigma24 family protein